jgi:hypothetical protein
MGTFIQKNDAQVYGDFGAERKIKKVAKEK